MALSTRLQTASLCSLMRLRQPLSLFAHGPIPDFFLRDPHGEDVPCLNHQLTDLWIFADKYSIPTFCNAAVDAIIEQYVEPWDDDHMVRSCLQEHHFGFATTEAGSHTLH